MSAMTKNRNFMREPMIRGTYDMNGDGEEDEISLLIKTDYSEGSYIEVNGKKLMIGYGNFSARPG